MMDAGNWHARGNGWGVWRVQEYLLVLQWLLENAPSDEHDFLQQHALKVRGRRTVAWYVHLERVDPRVARWRAWNGTFQVGPPQRLYQREPPRPRTSDRPVSPLTRARPFGPRVLYR